MRVRPLSLPTLALLAASVAAAEASAGAPSAVAAGTAGAARAVKESNDLYEFAYAYPQAVGGIPKLRAALDDRRARAKADLIAQAREDRASAKRDGYPYRPHSSDTTWRVVTELPGWLSLSATIYTYTGGAHGMTTFAALVWDREAGIARDPVDLFAAKPALRAALKQSFCAALDRERVKRRQQPLKPGDMFTDCIDPLAQTVILGSAGRRRFDRIGFLIEPYAAGAYAEGSYEVTLPVTPALLRAVKPKFRDAFVAR